MLAVEVRSVAPVELVIAFPYGSPAMNAADWSRPAAHRTTLDQGDSGRFGLIRVLDNDRYYVTLCWNWMASKLAPGAAHEFVLQGSDHFSLVAEFSPKPAKP